MSVPPKPCWTWSDDVCWCLVHVQSPMSKVRAAVVGVGYLGSFHAQKYVDLPDVELVAVVDSDPQTARDVAARFNVPAVHEFRELLCDVDAVSVVVPTVLHYGVAKELLERGIHVLLEKPMTTTVAQADDLIELAARNHAALQVGHLERFNAAVLALKGVLQVPLFIESHRLAPFKTRGADVDVVLDLMIHDIDIIRSIVRSPILSIDATGAAVLSNKTDIANARIRFESGCVVNVTASRVSMKTERKMRVFQNDAYISIDFQNNKLTIHRKETPGPHSKVPQISTHETIYAKDDPLKAEIAAFVNVVKLGHPPIVSGEDGRLALQTAIEITRQLEQPIRAGTNAEYDWRSTV